MYYFNFHLFCQLPKLLGIPQKVVSDSIFGNDYLYARRIDNQNSIKVNDVIKICNKFHISSKHFFMNRPAPLKLGERISYVISDDNFKTVLFKPERIKWVYGANGLANGLTRDKLAESLHITHVTLLRWANPELGGDIPVHCMLDMCNMYNLDLTTFIIDDNSISVPPAPEPEISPEPTVLNSRTWKELTELRKMLLESQRKINLLVEENNMLKNQSRNYSDALSEKEEYDYGTESPRKWIANWELLKNLTHVTGTSKRELMRVGNIGTYSNALEDGNMTIPSLVKICNKFQISSRHFFLRDANMPVHLKTYSQYRTDEWKKISFHPEYLNDLFGREGLTGLTRKDIAQMVGVSETTIRSWKIEYSTMRIKDMLNICNSLSVSPWCFITDLNRPDLEYGVTHTEFLLEENLLLRQQIIRLHEQIFRMKERYGILADK